MTLIPVAMKNFSTDYEDLVTETGASQSGILGFSTYQQR